MAEVRAYTNPPELVDLVMQAVMILRGGEPTWAEAKRQLADTSFINQLKEYDKENMSDRVLKKIGTYVSRPEFKPDTVGRVSFAAKSLCMWVRAMEVYGRIYRVVEPKKKRLESAMTQLAEKQASLAEARAKLQEVRGILGGEGKGAGGEEKGVEGLRRGGVCFFKVERAVYQYLLCFLCVCGRRDVGVCMTLRESIS